MHRAWLPALAVAGAAVGCAHAPKLAYTAVELRAEVERRAPDIPANEIVVPFELHPESVAIARKIVGRFDSSKERARALAEALVDPQFFGLRYSPTVTASAQETLRLKEGNCLSLASVFVGLARGVGLDAYYMDASVRVHELRPDEQEGMIVNEGHVTGIVKTPDANFGLDLARLGRIVWYRVIDDIEAVANFYNNRGFELIERAQERHEPANWAQAAHDFELATRVMPTFARAWNNLGIAAARQGHYDEAIKNYRTAIARDENLAAPYNNLGSLYLQTGDLPAAVKAFRSAARIEPRSPHVYYNLGVALLRRGDRFGAIEALERAVDLRGGYPEAQGLLDQLTSDAKAVPLSAR